MIKTLSSTIATILGLVVWAAPASNAAAITTHPQTTSGTVIGQVLDQSGSPIASAKVSIANENNGNVRATITNSNGSYTVAFLSPGLYTIVASAEGYQDGSVHGFQIPLNQTTPLRPPNITLTKTTTSQSASSSTTPAPSAESATLLTTSDATRRGNFTKNEVEGLPLGGSTGMRSFDELALLLPGVVPPPITPGVRGPGIGVGIGTSGEFSVNGMRSRSNNFTVDGSDDNDPDVGVRRQGFVALVPQSIESINELEVSTSIWDAELGRNFGSQVNAVSREGGRKYHGEAYSFFTDSSLNARNFFDYTGGPSGGKDPFTRTQSGFVIGGPITSDRLQFFSSYEHDQINASSEQAFATPSAADERFLGLTKFRVLQPFPSAASNEFFQTDLGATPLGKNLLSFYPAANNPGGPYGANTFTEVLPSGGRGDVFSTRITGQINSRNTLNARYNFTDDNLFIPAVNNAIDSTLKARTRTQDISLILDTTIRAQLYSQARFSFGRTRLGFDNTPQSPLTFAASSVEPVHLPGGGVQMLPSRTGAIGELQVEGFSPVGVDAFTFPQARASNSFQYADSISWSVGGHTIKFGGDIRRNQFNSIQDLNFRPDVVFGDALLSSGTLVQSPGGALALKNQSTSVLSAVQLATIGLPSSIFQTISLGTPDSEIGLRSTEFNFFVNDNWRVTRSFVVDYGLRYEYNTVPHEVNNKIESALGLQDLPQQASSAVNTPERLTAFSNAVAAYQQLLGGRTSIYDPYYKDFGPHAGFAWDIRGDGRTVLRGGYGIYYDAILGAVVSQSRDVFPTLIPANVDPGFVGFDVFVLNSPGTLTLPAGEGKTAVPLIANGTLNQLGGSPADARALIGALFLQNARGGGLAFTLPEKNLRTPYAQQWHLTLEHEFWNNLLLSLAYVGTKGTRLTRLTTPNLGPNVVSSILVANKFENFGPGFTSPPIVIADCNSVGEGSCVREPNRPQPSLGSFKIFEDSAASNYHAFQVEAKKRYSQGYTFTLAYTLSHSIDDVSDVFPISGAPTLPQDSFNLRLERASSNFDVRHRFAASFIWDVPLLKDQTNVPAHILRDWQISAVFEANSGQPFTLLLPVDANFDGNLTDRPSTTNGLVFANGHGPQRVAFAPGASVQNFVVLGQDGAVGRNSVRGDSFINLDLALTRSFHVRENQMLKFRAEFFNLANRANFGLPVPILGARGFGSAIDTVNRARTIQFALKYAF